MCKKKEENFQVEIKSLRWTIEWMRLDSMEALKPKEEPTSKFKEDLTDLCTSE